MRWLLLAAFLVIGTGLLALTLLARPDKQKGSVVATQSDADKQLKPTVPQSGMVRTSAAETPRLDTEREPPGASSGQVGRVESHAAEVFLFGDVPQELYRRVSPCYRGSGTPDARLELSYDVVVSAEKAHIENLQVDKSGFGARLQDCVLTTIGKHQWPVPGIEDRRESGATAITLMGLVKRRPLPKGPNEEDDPDNRDF